MLNTDDAMQLMASLDDCGNLHGQLKPQARARLYAVAENPSQVTWDDAHTIVLDSRSWMTLWQAVLEFTDYNVTSKSADDVWPDVPTSEQIVKAITEALAE